MTDMNVLFSRLILKHVSDSFVVNTEMLFRIKVFLNAAYRNTKTLTFVPRFFQPPFVSCDVHVQSQMRSSDAAVKISKHNYK